MLESRTPDRFLPGKYGFADLFTELAP